MLKRVYSRREHCASIISLEGRKNNDENTLRWITPISDRGVRLCTDEVPNSVEKKKDA